MSAKKELILPKTYLDKTEDGKYKHHDGRPKLSYSQLTSWVDHKYRPDYIKQYFVGINIDSGIFAQAGTDFGQFVEWVGMGKKGDKPECVILPQDNVESIVYDMEFPANSIYEDLIVLDCGNFVIEGYIDRSVYINNALMIKDFKTGNFKSKSKYESDDYMQTSLYCYAKQSEGYDIIDSSVTLYERKGNGTSSHPLVLTGESIDIPTPYCKKNTEKWLKTVSNIAEEISDYYKQYLKFFRE